jgi:glutamine amidotransferase
LTRVAILDYGMGNLRSVEKAFERVGSEAVITSDAAVAREADGLVLPGVGAFARAMERVEELELGRMLGERLEMGTPVLGICLGFQLLFESSTELGGARGLGLVEGEVHRLEAPGLKVPHIGWEPVSWTRPSALADGIEEATPFYFVHSFAPHPRHEPDALATAVHGGSFVCAIERAPLYGVQFHPEKSGAAGLRLLANFAEVCSRTSHLNGGEARLRPSDSASHAA